MNPLLNLQGKVIEVVYQEITYQGKLVGVGESEIYLQTVSNRVVLPMSGISAISASPKQSE